MMTPLPSPPQLIELAYHYYPRGILYDRTAEPSPELRQRLEVCDQAWEKRGRWQAFLEQVEHQLPGCWIWDETLPRQGGAYKSRVFPPRFSQYHLPASLTAVGLVSYLAPVYLVYASFLQRDPQDERRDLPPVLSYQPEGEIAPYARTLAEAIEAVFDYPALPLDIASLPVPDIQVGNLRYGTARLIDVLFMDDRT